MTRLLCIESYPQALAGQQETLSALLTRARARGWETHVAAPRDGVFLERLRGEGTPISVHAQPGSIDTYGGAVYRQGRLEKLRSVIQVAGYVRSLRRVIRTQAPDVVFCNDMRGLLTFGVAARSLRLPVVIWDKLDRPHGILDALQLPLATLNPVIAHGVTVKYPAWQRRRYAHKIERIADGIDTAAFAAPPAPGAPWPIPDGAPLVTIIGTVGPRKGHDTLLEAWTTLASRHPTAHLAIVGPPGDGQEGFAGNLRAKAPPNVHWLGQRTDIPAIVGATTILASPSRQEGMGRVNVEAMAAARPVVGTLDTGIAEVVVDGETGLLVPPGDASALAHAIDSLLSDPARAARMGQAGQARARAEFEAARQLDRMLDLLAGVAT